MVAFSEIVVKSAEFLNLLRKLQSAVSGRRMAKGPVEHADIIAGIGKTAHIGNFRDRTCGGTQ